MKAGQQLVHRAVTLPAAAARAAGHQVGLAGNGAAPQRHSGEPSFPTAQAPHPADQGGRLPTIGQPEIAQGCSATIRTRVQRQSAMHLMVEQSPSERASGKSEAAVGGGLKGQTCQMFAQIG